MIKFKLKEIMNTKGLKISDLNEATGISRNSLSLLINGKSQGIQFENLEKIASKLSVEIGDLFERVFDDLKITIGEKEEISVKKQNTPTRYYNSPRDFFALKCSVFEDGIERVGYIPYNFSVEIKPKPYIAFAIDLKYSEFHSYFNQLFNDYSQLQLIFLNFFAKKVIESENEKLKIIENNLNIPLDRIEILISGGNSSVIMQTRVNFNDFEYNNKQIKSCLNDLNESNIYNFEFEDSIKIYTK